MTSSRNTTKQTIQKNNWRTHDSAADGVNFEITAGDYSGVWFRFGRVAMLPDEEGTLRFNFDYEILDSAGYEIEDLTSEEFKYRLLVILQEYLGVEFGSN